MTLLKSLYRTMGLDIDVQEGSNPWMAHQVNALLLEGLQNQAALNVAQAFADTASDESVEHHARVHGLTRKADVDAILEILVTGTPGSTWSAGDTLTSADGIIYTVLFGYGGTIPGGGSATARVLATPLGGLSRTGLGAQTNKTAGAVLSWGSPPSGIDATASVAEIIRQGANLESNDALARRILGRLREKPSGFNRAEVRDLLERRPGVAEAYVYRAYQGSPNISNPEVADVGTPDTAGWVTILALAEPPNRLFSLAEIQEINAYLNSEIPGNILTARVQVFVPPTTTQAVAVELVLGGEYAFPFTGTYEIAGGSTLTVLNVTTNPLAAGPTQVLTGDRVAVPVSSARGGFELRRVAGTTSSTITLEAALSAPATVGDDIYPAPANWEAARDAVLAVFDALGPGDTTGLGNSLRYPVASERGPSTLFVSQITSALVRRRGPFGEDVGVDGIVAANVMSPVGDVAATELQLILPGKITFTEA